MRTMMLGRLVRPMLRLLNRDERGAVGVLVAILIGGGVLVGMGAMVVDVANLYQYRAELQSGADAGALAVAQSCAQGTCTPNVAASFASANAKSGVASVNLVCGSSGLGNCPTSTGKLTDCPTAPAAGTPYVDVHTQSLTSSGSSLVPPFLARTLLGNGNYKGSTVFACARAQWGPPATATATSLTIDDCVFESATNDGTSFAQAPPYPQNPQPSKSYDQVLNLSTDSSDGCNTFNWTTDNGNCSASFSTDYDAISVSDGVPSDCVSVISTSQTNRTVILVPIYGNGDSCGHGQDAAYVLEGFAAFVVTGYHFGTKGPSAADWLNSKNSCTGSANCVNGYFVRTVLTTQGTIGGQDMGAEIIALTG